MKKVLLCSNLGAVHAKGLWESRNIFCGKLENKREKVKIIFKCPSTGPEG